MKNLCFFFFILFQFGLKSQIQWVEKNGQFAIEKNGKIISGFIYEEVLPFDQQSRAVAKVGQSCFLVSDSGQISEPYRFIYPSNNGLYLVRKGHDRNWDDCFYTFINKFGQQAQGWDWYHIISTFNNGMAWVQNNTKAGIVGWNGRVIVPLEYDEVYLLRNAVGFVVKKNDSYGILDSVGKFVVSLQSKFKFDLSNYFQGSSSGGSLIAAKDLSTLKWGYINVDGQMVISAKYKFLQDFENGTAIVQNFDNKYGVIDTAGEIVIPMEFERISRNQSGVNTSNWFFHVEKERGYGLFDSKGRVIIEPIYKSVGDFYGRLFYYSSKERHVYYFVQSGKKQEFKHYCTPLVVHYNKVFDCKDEDLLMATQIGAGRVLLQKAFGDTTSFGEFQEIGLYHPFRIYAKRGDKYGFIDTNGKTKIPFIYDEVGDFCSGLAFAKKDGQYGYIDYDGNWRIPPRFESVSNFGDDAAAVREGDLYGVIDTNGVFILKPAFEHIEEFTRKVAKVYQSGKYGIINNHGAFLINPDCEEITQLYPELYIYKRDFVKGLVSINGEVLPHTFFNNPFISDKPLFAVGILGKKFTFMDKSGQLVLPPIFDFDASVTIEDFSDGKIWVSKYGEKFEVNRNGLLFAKPE